MELRYYVGLFLVTVIIYIVNDQQWARQIESELPLDSVVLINDVVDEKRIEQDEHRLDDDDAKLLNFITNHWPVGTMKYRQFNTSIWYTTGKKPVVQNYTYEETHRIDEQWTRQGVDSLVITHIQNQIEKVIIPSKQTQQTRSPCP